MTLEGTFGKVLDNLVKAEAEVRIYVGNIYIDGVVTCICDDCIIVSGAAGGLDKESFGPFVMQAAKRYHVVLLNAIIDIAIYDEKVHPLSR